MKRPDRGTEERIAPHPLLPTTTNASGLTRGPAQRSLPTDSTRYRDNWQKATVLLRPLCRGLFFSAMIGLLASLTAPSSRTGRRS